MDDDKCSICGCDDPSDLKNHDPAYHVAKAYHYPKEVDKKLYCASCEEVWKCSTILVYTI